MLLTGGPWSSRWAGPEGGKRGLHSELPKRDFVSVQIDHVQMGVGGDNSWGLPELEEYRVKADGKYEWSFVMGVVGE